jgi:hypothetical protein
VYEKLILTDPIEGVPNFDHTKLSAINTCPVYGLVRYSHHKVISHSERELPLEAGQCAHEAFAAVRLYQLGYVQNRPDLMDFHGKRIFKEKWDMIKACHMDNRTVLSNATNFAITAFELTGYYDDPSDKRRTKDNIIESLMMYTRLYDMKNEIWIRDPSRADSDVGIEIPFKIGIMFRTAAGVELALNYTGKIDGIFISHYSGNITVDENKTGSRLDEAWLAQWRMSNQITGYAVAAAKFIEHHEPIIPNARIVGMQIPLPRDAQNGVRQEIVPRSMDMMSDWGRWLYHTVSLHNQYNNDPVHAPRYTHSCNRYFRACSFLPLCDAPADERPTIFMDMPISEWTPLEE